MGKVNISVLILSLDLAATISGSGFESAAHGGTRFGTSLELGNGGFKHKDGTRWLM